MWKIYKHTLMLECASKGKSYIGQTSAENPNRRWAHGKGYSRKNPLFYNAIKKYGWDNFKHEILFDNISTLEEANKIEIELIAKYHTYIGDPECWGYNTTPGGSGRPHKQTEETKQKISQTLTGRKFTEEHKANLSKTLKRKPIICIETGMQYESVSEAARQTGIHRENIKTAINGKRLSAGGYHWAQVDDTATIEELKKLNGKCKAAKRKVLCIETGEIFDSITEAAKAVNGIPSGISSYLSGRYKTAYGYHWKYL